MAEKSTSPELPKPKREDSDTSKVAIIREDDTSKEAIVPDTETSKEAVYTDHQIKRVPVPTDTNNSKILVESHSDLIPVTADEPYDGPSPPYASPAQEQTTEHLGQRAIQPDMDYSRELSQPVNTGRNDGEPDEWDSSFWKMFANGSIGCEALTCPCVLAGRTYMRLKEPENPHHASTSAYCTSCCALVIPGIIGLPLCWIMTVATRREIRYKYNLKGDNCDDCWRATLCVWCALAQEEREVVARQRKPADAGYTRTPQMVYSPGATNGKEA